MDWEDGVPQDCYTQEIRKLAFNEILYKCRERKSYMESFPDIQIRYNHEKEFS